CAASRDAGATPSDDVVPPGGQQERSSATAAETTLASATSTPTVTTPTIRTPTITTPTITPPTPPVDSARAARAAAVATDSTPKEPPITVPSVAGRTRKDSIALVSAIRAGKKSTLWPVKTPPPLPGSILPAKRIVAYYGNPLSKRMGILGELPPDQMLAKFDKEIAAWARADPSTPVQPALHLVTVVAQGAPGRDGKYRLRMTDSLIETVASWAARRNAIVFLDLQVALSTVQEELPRLIPFLRRPNFHLGLDPEFSMKGGEKPGSKIGSMNAADINYAIGVLANLVTEHNLPPKVLVIHRFTRPMVKGYKNIKLDPRVQVVIHMDGWGQPWLKYDSYRDYVASEPVQFTGFKIFYKNDTKKGDPIITPGELLFLHPKPVYIQYQ
ncbi:MAG TPA: hypothetical protein VFS56_08130, partial [Gemmatimonadaceae bacterium]|nr:hypothetical protein [Gemmatimonadaceae bacterium]